jgi:hypothetical protein
MNAAENWRRAVRLRACVRRWIWRVGAASLFPALVNLQIQSQSNPSTTSSTARVSVHGVVLNAASGEPLARALVRMTGEGSPAMLTDGEGRFELTNVPTGAQQFAIVKPGYLDAIAEAAAAAGGDAKEFAHTVIVAAEMPDVTFRMAPANAIHGVVQLSTGDSAQGIEITLLKQTVQNGRFCWRAASTTRTDADGAYRFGGLTDGTYAVYNAPAMENDTGGPAGASKTRSGYPSQFYSAANDLSGAAKIQLQGGEQSEANLSLTLETFQPVTATAYTPDGASRAPGDGPGLSAMVTDSQGRQLAYPTHYSGSTHTVEAVLPDGSYSLVVTAGGSTLAARRGGIGSASREDGPYIGAAEFSVTRQAVTNLRIPLASAPRSAVQVSLTAGSSSSAGGENAVFLTMSQTGGWIGDGMTTAFASGSYPGTLTGSFPGPGSYWIHANLPDKHVCEAGLTAGGTNLAREPLTLGVSGSAPPITLNLRNDCATLSLSLPGDAGGSGAGEEPFYTVYVVPDFDSTQDVVTQTLRASTGAKAMLQGLTPGSYHVYVFDTPVALAYRERSALDALPAGQTIDLAPNQTGNLTLEVPKS